MTAPSGEFSVDVLEVHQQPQLSQIWPPGVFLDPRLRGDDDPSGGAFLRGGRPGASPFVIPAQAGIQKVDLLRETSCTEVIFCGTPTPTHGWNKATRILGAIGQKWRIFNIRVQTHVRLLGLPVSGRSLAGEAWPRPYRHPTWSQLRRGEAMPRPPASNRGCPNPVSQVMNQRTQLPAAQND